MTIQDILIERQIVEVVHFTTNRGVVGVLAQGQLQSRERLDTNQYLENVLYVNAASRAEAAASFNKDENWIDFVNLSISSINRHYFDYSSLRWHVNQDVWWAILAFDSMIATHPGVYFATTNNVYEHCRRTQGVDGLQATFAQTVRRKGNWYARRGARPPYLCTCQQAELLYPGAISLDHLVRIYVRDEQHCDIVRGWLRDFGYLTVDVVISESKFQGSPN